MKKLFIVLSLLGLIFVPMPALAHTTNEAGGNAVVMHIEPNDNPAAGEAAKIIMDVNDPDHEFNPATCDCKVTIFSGDQQLVQLTAAKETDTAVSVTTVFAKTGTFQVRFDAKQSEPASFEPITTSFSVDVTEAAQAPTSDAQPTSVATNYLIWGLVVAGSLIAINSLIAKRRDQIKPKDD